MLSPHLLKFSDIYKNYGLGAAKNFFLLTSLITQVRTVTLWKLKDHVSTLLGKATSNPDSDYRRLTRFFETWGDSEPFLYDIMRLNLQLLRKAGFRTLVMDGTSWKLGETEFHYLVLTVLVNDVAIPIYWKQLEKIGASSQDERKALMDEASSILDLNGMTLLADREYIGKDWFNHLIIKGLNFVIRMKMGDYEQIVNAIGGRTYRNMLTRCQRKNKLVSKRIFLDQTPYRIVMLPNPKPDADEPVMIFLTTLANAKHAAACYKHRWKIECLFKHLKTNGYNLEDIHLKHAGKTRLMLAIVVTAYILAVKEGWKRKNQIPLKEYADGTTFPAMSIFRAGLAFVIEKCHRLHIFLKYFQVLLQPKRRPILENVQ